MSSNQSQANRGRTMTIGELSDITGLSVSAIRFYERRGLLPARDADGGWQRYGEDAVSRLAVIQLAKSAGFNLDETIRILDALDVDPDSVPATPPIWRGLAEVKLIEIDTLIGRLQDMRRLLQDALTYSYLSPDRVRQVPAALGWTAALPDKLTALPETVQIPDSTKDLGSGSAGDTAASGAERDQFNAQG